MRTANWIIGVALATAALQLSQPAQAGEKPIKKQTIVVNLTSPISTQNSKPGDTFTAIVLEPAEYEHAIVEGHVRKVEPAQNMESPKAHINFAFETMTVGDVTYKIQADLEEVVNSKGAAKVDEEGQVIAKGNGGKRALAGLGGAGIGAFAGGMLGGGMGSLIGGAVGGAAGYLVALDVTASSHNIEFYPGTHFTLEVNSKGVDKGVNAEAVRQLEASNEQVMHQQAAAASGPTPSPAPGPTPSPSPSANSSSAPQNSAAPALPQM
ncbi:MAG TPA: hypothetical protein VKB38_10290 [Terracidiphilus sp.]|nr:hypothetical protein [Terracidiphilus sp.]